MIYPYLALKVAETASTEEIRAAYLKLVHEFPPEHSPKKFQEIHEAYELIKDEISRAKLKLFGMPDYYDNQNDCFKKSFIDLLPKPEIKRIKIGVDNWIDVNAN